MSAVEKGLLPTNFTNCTNFNN